MAKPKPATPAELKKAVEEGKQPSALEKALSEKKEPKK